MGGGGRGLVRSRGNPNFSFQFTIFLNFTSPCSFWILLKHFHFVYTVLAHEEMALASATATTVPLAFPNWNCRLDPKYLIKASFEHLRHHSLFTGVLGESERCWRNLAGQAVSLEDTDMQCFRSGPFFRQMKFLWLIFKITASNTGAICEKNCLRLLTANLNAFKTVPASISSHHKLLDIIFLDHYLWLH